MSKNRYFEPFSDSINVCKDVVGVITDNLPIIPMKITGDFHRDYRYFVGNYSKEVFTSRLM